MSEDTEKVKAQNSETDGSVQNQDGAAQRISELNRENMKRRHEAKTVEEQRDALQAQLDAQTEYVAEQLEAELEDVPEAFDEVLDGLPFEDPVSALAWIKKAKKSGLFGKKKDTGDADLAGLPGGTPLTRGNATADQLRQRLAEAKKNGDSLALIQVQQDLAALTKAG